MEKLESLAVKPVRKPKIWTDEVRKAWELPERLTVSQWADRSRVLDAANAEPGPWHTERTPYLKGVMDALNDSNIEDITIMASTQCGKTESMLNMMGYVIDQDPGPMLLVMPREDDAKSISSKRVIPMLRNSVALRSHFTTNSDDITKMEITLDRMTIFLAGANSPAALAQRPIRYLFLDETDKYPLFSGNESDPIKLSTERTRTFWNRKIVKCSTPTTEDGYIFREYESSDRRKYYVPCPFCEKKQILLWSQVKWPEKIRDPEEIKSRRVAWYECAGCKKKITDGMKQRMLLKGEWIAEGFAGEGEFRRSRAGFWINAIYSPWLSFSEIAAEWLNSYEKPELLMNFINSWLAEPWRENLGKTHPDEVRKLQRLFQAGIVPAEALVLTGGVDVQKDHFYATIRAWGYHQRSWNILAVRVEHWEDVIQVMFRTSYASENPNIDPFPVRLTCIDTGYRTSEVYEICSAWRDITRPVKGRDQLGGIPYRSNVIERFPDTGAIIPGGLALYTLDTSYFKDKVKRLMQNTALDGPAGWFIHKNPSHDYVKQLCSEHKVIIRDKKTRRAREEWRPVSTHAATHFWDCEIYGTAAAEMLRVFYWKEEPGNVVHRPVERDAEFNYKNWIPRKTDWMTRNG